MGKTKSLDQCISSASVQDESYRQCVEGPMKPMFLMGTSEFGINPLQVDTGHSMPRIPYAYSDPYGGGIFTAYGPQAMIRPQAVGIAPAQLPLPLDLAEDGPIYVNAKQYHGIIRRRQIRAKLEAQNKLVKSRRPYLHESRHVHALKRVRGSGGRFLSTKKPQPPDPTPATSSHFALDSAQFSQKRGVSNVSFPLETSKHNASVTSRSGIKRATDGGVLVQQPDHRFSSLSPHMQGSGGRLMSNVTQHRAPVVR